MDNQYQNLSSSTAITGRGQITQNANGSLKAPENIIMQVEAARTYYMNARGSHVERIILYAAIEGLIAGNPPYDSYELEKAGLGHIANVNTLDAKGIYERAALTFWNLINQTANVVKFSLKKFENQEDQDYSTWAEILSRNWTEVVVEMWPDFITQFNVMTGQLVKFGLSPVIWPDEHSFKWESVDVSRMFVSDKCPVDSSKWDYVCIETPFTMQYLWGVYDHLTQLSAEEQAGAPWCKAALEDFLIKRANNVVKGPGPGVSAFTNALDIQTALQNGDSNTAAVFSDTVPLVTLLYREYSGKISNYLFDPIGQGSSDFLFKISEQYENFNEGFLAFTYSPGERYLHGNRGVGHKIYPICQGMMQLDCNMLDMGKMASTPIIKGNNTLGRSVDPIRFISGVPTDVGAADFVQNQLGANINQLQQLGTYFERKVNRNAAISGDDPSQPDADRGSKSAPEAQMNAIKEFGPGKQVVGHFYGQFDQVVYQMVSKMLHCKQGMPAYEVTEEWKNRCFDEGVPPEIFELNGAPKGKLPKHLRVRASRVAGDGSNLGLQMGLRSVGGIAGGFPAKGQFNYRHDVVNSSLGIDYVDRYLGTADEPDEATGGASTAMLENFAMEAGKMPQASRDNQHKAHIGSHMSWIINSIIKPVQSKQLDAITADKYLSIGLPHTGEHIDFVSQDSLNQAFVKQIEPSWKQIQKFAQLNRVKAQKMQQTELQRRQDAEQKLTAEQLDEQRKNLVTQGNEKRADFKVQNQAERAKEASQVRADTMKKSVELKADTDRLAVQLKAENENKKINLIKKPEEVLANESSSQIQSDLANQVGVTPNPADFD